MTFPAILEATQSPWSGLAALVVGILMAWWGRSLFQVAVGSCLVVLVAELFLVWDVPRRRCLCLFRQLLRGGPEPPRFFPPGCRKVEDCTMRRSVIK